MGNEIAKYLLVIDSILLILWVFLYWKINDRIQSLQKELDMISDFNVQKSEKNELD